jgi:predicted HicB family RNase H-like nuclease
MGRPQVINEAEDVRVVVPLRISYRQRDRLRDMADEAHVSVNQFLLDALERADVHLS